MPVMVFSLTVIKAGSEVEALLFDLG